MNPWCTSFSSMSLKTHIFCKERTLTYACRNFIFVCLVSGLVFFADCAPLSWCKLAVTKSKCRNYDKAYSRKPYCSSYLPCALVQNQNIQRFEQKLRGKLLTFLRAYPTVVFTGDSTMRQLFRSALCTMSYKDLSYRDSGLFSSENHRWEHCRVYDSTFTICYTSLSPGTILKIVQKGAQLTNAFLVANFGLHYNDRKLELQRDSLHFAHNITAFGLQGRSIWLETSAQHFATPNGLYSSSLPIPYQCKTIPIDKYSEANWRNEMSSAAVRSVGIPVLDTFNISFFAPPEVHAHGDCTHMCQPGLPEVILDMILDFAWKPN